MLGRDCKTRDDWGLGCGLSAYPDVEFAYAGLSGNKSDVELVELEKLGRERALESVGVRHRRCLNGQDSVVDAAWQSGGWF